MGVCCTHLANMSKHLGLTCVQVGSYLFIHSINEAFVLFSRFWGLGGEQHRLAPACVRALQKAWVLQCVMECVCVCVVKNA